MKKLIIFSLFVFVGLIAMSYVSAGATVEVNTVDESFNDCDDIDLSYNDNKLLKNGKEIKKTVKMTKKVKKYGKTKSKSYKSVAGKKATKKDIKKAFKGKSSDPKLNKKLNGHKLLKIKFKSVKVKWQGVTGFIWKATIKYKPVTYKTVTKKVTVNIHAKKWNGGAGNTY